MTTERELLPCPFCGGEGRAQQYFGHWVGCDDCDAQGAGADSKVGAIAAWNRRAALAQPAQPVKDPRLEEWCPRCKGSGEGTRWVRTDAAADEITRLRDRIAHLERVQEAADALRYEVTVTHRALENAAHAFDAVRKGEG